MTATITPLAELTASTIRLLIKEIGVVDTVRFINQFSTGYGNYTEERDTLFQDMTVDEITRAIKQQRPPNQQ